MLVGACRTHHRQPLSSKSLARQGLAAAASHASKSSRKFLREPMQRWLPKPSLRPRTGPAQQMSAPSRTRQNRFRDGQSLKGGMRTTLPPKTAQFLGGPEAADRQNDEDAASLADRKRCRRAFLPAGTRRGLRTCRCRRQTSLRQLPGTRTGSPFAPININCMRQRLNEATTGLALRVIPVN